MTPCEELGYKVGDKFVVVDKEAETVGFELHQIVALYEDDETEAPLFQGKNSEYTCCDGEEGAYLQLTWVKPLKTDQQLIITQIKEKELICKL